MKTSGTDIWYQGNVVSKPQQFIWIFDSVIKIDYVLDLEGNEL